jgi:hypothetical protein
MTTTVNFLIRLILTGLLVAWAVMPYFDNSTNDSEKHEPLTRVLRQAG